MRFFIFNFIAVFLLAASPAASAQSSTPAGGAEGSELPALATPPRSDMLEAAHEFRQASEALERFVRGLARILADGGEVAVKLSENLAAASGEFDPFGFKNAALAMQQQTAIIQRQSETIERLQQREIRRLRRELRRAKRDAE